MENTRAQASATAMEVVAQNEAPPAGNRATDRTEPDVHRLAADVGDMKLVLRALCENTGTAWPGTAPPASQASTSRRERRREAARRRRANRPNRTAALAAPSENDQNEAESHPADDDREDSPEGCNPRNSHGNGRPTAECSNGERAMQEKPTPSFADLRRSPFAMDLRMQPLSSKFKMPVLEGYDGSKDPMDHLNCFRAHLSLQGASEALMCQCFPVTFRGDALLWFHGLPPNSIRSFDELADSFSSQFASSRREERQPWHLVRRRQRSDESLKREAETIAREYITAEEANEVKSPERADRPPEASRASSGRKRDGDSQRFPERRKQQRPPPGPRKDYSRASLTPLNDSRTNIML
ncbi:hypothetical protein Nepgr_029829 [Nepenthes gracilis]|uniref:Retrotransposon gag domain-containing protein n=1 Tax=Nepenthes gracilis TaxID=150966 RepID=A0AAD3TF13_NEPGR|nr:hypothetical protein Nepgr_029829 [Nepenthes gracilis]